MSKKRIGPKKHKEDKCIPQFEYLVRLDPPRGTKIIHADKVDIEDGILIFSAMIFPNCWKIIKAFPKGEWFEMEMRDKK